MLLKTHSKLLLHFYSLTHFAEIVFRTKNVKRHFLAESPLCNRKTVSVHARQMQPFFVLAMLNVSIVIRLFSFCFFGAKRACKLATQESGGLLADMNTNELLLLQPYCLFFLLAFLSLLFFLGFRGKGRKKARLKKVEGLWK